VKSCWRLTTRHGSDVEKTDFDSPGAALDALRRGAIQVLGEGPLKEINALRDFEPGQQVAARFSITAPSRIRVKEAGMDVKGDGSLVPYTGAIRKEPIEMEAGEDPYEVLSKALEGLR
jgi:hypothetical protein